MARDRAFCQGSMSARESVRRSYEFDTATAPYKKAMLVFYERSNVTAFKRLFIEQYGFAVRTYF